MYSVYYNAILAQAWKAYLPRCADERACHNVWCNNVDLEIRGQKSSQQLVEHNLHYNNHMVARTCKKIQVFLIFVVVSTLAASLTWIRPMEGEAAEQILARLQSLESENQSLRVQMLAMQAQQTSTPEI
jgi:hypothetical protein